MSERSYYLYYKDTSIAVKADWENPKSKIQIWNGLGWDLAFGNVEIFGSWENALRLELMGRFPKDWLNYLQILKKAKEYDPEWKFPDLNLDLAI